VIDRAQILEAVSGSVASLERDVPDAAGSEAGNGR